MNDKRTLDWRFLAMLTFFLMVGYLVLTGVVAIQQNAEKGRQIDSLIAASHRADDAATRQRDELLSAQHRLLTRLDAYDAQQRALLGYLRVHGVQIPTRFVEAPRASGGNAARTPRRSSLFTPQPPPSIAAPGNSGGHRHGTKKPHSLNRHAQ